MDLPLVSLTQGSPMHILNSLPNEILRDIFEFLDIKDLTMAADSCTKFRSMAKETISEQHSLIDEDDISKMDKRTLAKFLRNFGACIASYVLNCENMTYGCKNRYLELFCHCFDVGDIALKNLEIIKYSKEQNDLFSKPIQRITSRLRTLKLTNCTGLRKSWGIKSTGRQ